ncbi:MAG: ATP-binding protein [Pseudomonadales bacterium]|nr:ATP-binding protein [Pseudomonadales bacterium]
MKNKKNCTLAFDRGLVHVVLKLLLPLLLMGGAANSMAHDSSSHLDSLHFINDSSHAFVADILINNPQAPWQKAPYRSLNLGFTESVVWLKFEIPAHEEASEKLFEIANHKISDIELFVASLSQDQKTSEKQWQIMRQFKVGDGVPISERVYPHRNFVFPIETSASEPRLILVRIQNKSPMKLPLNIWSEREFQSHDVDRMLFQGIYFGSVLIMALYNLCIFFFVKDKSYAAYVLFIVLFAAIVAVDKGLAAQYLWPNNTGIDFQVYEVLVAFGAASSALFTIYFLSLKEHSPNLTKWFYGLIGLWLTIGLVAIIRPSIWLLAVEMVVLIPGGTALFLAGVISWRKGVAAAPYYVISWAVVILGVLVYAAYLLGLLAVTVVTEYILQVSNMIEAALLSLGLAYRIKVLDEEKRSAHALTQAKSDFLATMSHEIRTPMNGILGMAQLLKDTKLNQQQDGYLSTILGSGQTLLTVLNDILDYSKIEAGKLKVESISYNIRRLVDETAGVFAVKATERNLYYNTFLSPHVPIKIDGDPTRVRQILTNFLSNAFKFTESGRVTIQVLRELNENQLRFEVHDTGIGIPEEKLGSVFQEFTQADSSTTRQYGGTGLGLPISRRLVEIMGGDIGVRSTINEGSVFWFTLPIVNEVPFDRVNNENLAKDIKNSRFLLISPERQFGGQVADYSHLWGFEFIYKDSIHQAISDLDNEAPFDFIIVDQYSEDFSYEVISHDLIGAIWAKDAKLILTMRPGSDRMAFSQLKPEPWIEEYPVSITRIQLRFLGEQGFSFSNAREKEVSDYSGMRILLVEDNPVNAKVASAFIAKLGIEPKVVDSGEEALELVCHEKREFDLVFMDCEMPGIDGYTATRHIRDFEILNTLPPLQICALSAHAMDSHRDKCLDAGMNDFLTKPLVFNQLKNKIDEAYKLCNKAS